MSDLRGGDPRTAIDVREILVASYQSNFDRFAEMRDWLMSDLAEGRAIWQTDNLAGMDELNLVIGFSHPSTAFAFKMRFL